METTSPVAATDHVTSRDSIYALVGTSGPNRLDLNDTMSPYEPIAAQILSAAQKGAALWQFDVWDGSPEDVYATFATTAPTGARYSEYGQVSWASESTQTSYNCGTVDNPSSNPECTTTALNPLSAVPSDTQITNANLDPLAIYTVRVFDATASAWIDESACSSGTGCENTDLRAFG